MKIEDLLMSTMMVATGLFDWLIYQNNKPPPGFHDSGPGWDTHRRFLEDTYGLRRKYKPGCVTLVFVILVVIGYLIGKAVYS